MKGGNILQYHIEYLYQTYKTDIYTYFISLTRNKTLSEDLTSETFLTAIRCLPSFQGKSTIKTWLFGIARNKWLEHLKKAYKTGSQIQLAQLYAQTEFNIEETAIQKECISRIYHLVEMQAPVQKQVFLLRLEGYSFLEIAEKLQISQNSARVIDFRLKNKIRNILEKEDYVDE